ncbi:hypothetical protein RRG08_061303 [Elysia crispata]|uniref:Uncharacterized protein n=1 Tax=Elysia crispata TaxID=231223 RepID=A0AAE0YFR0_9GAST|nr:hypothetical protein RRG08_061303 [Elysia crispata]
MVVMAVSGTVRSCDKPCTAGYRLPAYCEERDEDGCDGGLVLSGQVTSHVLPATGYPPIARRGMKMVVMAVWSSDKPRTAGYRLPAYCEERDEDGCDGCLVLSGQVTSHVLPATGYPPIARRGMKMVVMAVWYCQVK